MRDFRDAKAMAHSLRDALKVKAVETTHSECLELIAKVFGYENWNILSAKIDAARSSASDADASATTVPKPDKTLYCTFCGKSQHEVKTLIAGPPPTFVCNECVSLCNDVLDDEEVLSLLKADDERGNQSYPTAFEYVLSKSTEQLISKVERAKKGAETWRFGLQQLKRKLAMREGEVPAEGDVLTSPGFAYLQNKKRDDLLAFQRHHEQALKRYEVAQRIVTTVLGERGQ